MKCRTHGHDVMQPARAKAAKPGKIGEGKLGVFDRGPDGELRLRGQVGALATSSTAARFHGKLGSTIQIVGGRKASSLRLAFPATDLLQHKGPSARRSYGRTKDQTSEYGG